MIYTQSVTLETSDYISTDAYSLNKTKWQMSFHENKVFKDIRHMYISLRISGSYIILFQWFSRKGLYGWFLFWTKTPHTISFYYCPFQNWDQQYNEISLHMSVYRVVRTSTKEDIVFIKCNRFRTLTKFLQQFSTSFEYSATENHLTLTSMYM